MDPFEDECTEVELALSRVGVEEKSLIDILGKWNSNQRSSFRNSGSANDLFGNDARNFERCQEEAIVRIRHEFLRFKNAVLLWIMHPWERDARLIKEAMIKDEYGHEHLGVVIEVACTRSSDALLGARKAYHSLFDHSMEEDVASHVKAPFRKLLVALVSAYRYEGSHVHEETAKSEAKALHSAITNADDKKLLLEDDVVIRILSTRSKTHLKAVYHHYKDISGNNLDEEFNKDVDITDEIHLKYAIQCLCFPEKYFAKTIMNTFVMGADGSMREGLTRVVVSQADINLKGIKEEFANQFGDDLATTVETACRGNYRDFILSLLARERQELDAESIREGQLNANC